MFLLMEKIWARNPLHLIFETNYNKLLIKHLFSILDNHQVQINKYCIWNERHRRKLITSKSVFWQCLPDSTQSFSLEEYWKLKRFMKNSCSQIMIKVIYDLPWREIIYNPVHTNLYLNSLLLVVVIYVMWIMTMLIDYRSNITSLYNFIPYAVQFLTIHVKNYLVDTLECLWT